MNTRPDIAIDAPSAPAISKPATPIETCVRQHPGGTLLFAAGLGLAAVLIARALTPAPPRNRALSLLEDIQEHLATLAEDGANAVGKGVEGLGDLHLDRSFGKLSRRFKKLFHS